MKEKKQKKGQNAHADCIPKKLPPWKPSQDTLPHTPWARTWSHGHIEMQERVGKVPSTLDDHMPRQIQGPTTMEEEGCEY